MSYLQNSKISIQCYGKIFIQDTEQMLYAIFTCYHLRKSPSQPSQSHWPMLVMINCETLIPKAKKTISFAYAGIPKAE